MASCNVNTLIASAACFCKVTASPKQMVKLSLLCQILTNLGGMACDVNSLMAQAGTFGKVTQNPFEMLELQLLCAISAAASGGGGGGGVSGSVLCGAANPVAAPTTSCAVYVKQNGVTSGIWVWDGAAWQQLI